MLDGFNKILNSKDISRLIILIVVEEGEKDFITEDERAEKNEKFTKKKYKVFIKLESLEILVIAAINRLSLRNGFELSLNSDFRICPDNALFVLSGNGVNDYVFWGIQRLTKLIGIGKTKQILYLNNNIKVEESLKIGLINGIYPQKELL